MPLVLKELASSEATNRRNAAFCVGELCKNGHEPALKYPFSCHPFDSFTLNSLGVFSFAFCGVALFNNEGKFIQTFSKRLDHCSIVEAELWPILYRMNMALDSRIMKLIVESDSLDVVKLLDDDCYSRSQF